MRATLRFLGLLLLSALALQLAFALRIALMAVLDPQSTTFQRSSCVSASRRRISLRWKVVDCGSSTAISAMRNA